MTSEQIKALETMSKVHEVRIKHTYQNKIVSLSFNKNKNILLKYETKRNGAISLIGFKYAHKVDIVNFKELPLFKTK